MSNRYRFWVVVYVLMMCLFVGVAHQLLTRSAIGHQITETQRGLGVRHLSSVMEYLTRVEAADLEQTALAARQLTSPPKLSHPSGIYPEGVVVSVLLPGETVGYFSVDGSIPTRRDSRVSGPITISTSTTLRVKSFARSGTSETATATYIVNRMPDVVFADLVLDPVYLFDRHAGIYSNPLKRGRSWERPGTLIILDPSRDQPIELAVSVRIHGGGSRGSGNEGRKSFRIRTELQAKEFRRWLDAGTHSIDPSQNQWILRHVGNERQLWSDRFIQRVAEQIDLPVSIAQPVVLHVNGTMWGVYDLMERINEALLAGKENPGRFLLLHGMPLQYPLKRSAEYDDWNRLYRQISEGDPSDPTLYEYIKERIDIRSLIDYFALSIFMADSDRPHWNIDIYRQVGLPGGGNGKWKFAVWDFDGGLNYRGMFTRHDTLAWHLRSSLRPDLKPVGTVDDPAMQSATQLLRGLMRNYEFRDAFTERFYNLLASNLSTDNLQATLNTMLREYAGVIPMEQRRFETQDEWLLEGVVRLDAAEVGFSYEDRMKEIRTFISERPEVVSELLKERFGAGELSSSP